MKNSIVGVFGASGFGREVMPLVRRQYVGSNAHLVFVDDNPPSVVLNGHSVLTYQQFLHESAGEKFITIAIADSGIRKMLAERCVRDGISIFDVLAIMLSISHGQPAKCTHTIALVRWVKTD
jgi:hypothetical protein